MLYVNYVTIKEKNNKLSYKKSLLAHWGERFRKIQVLLSLTLSNQQHTSTTSRANTTVQSTRQQVFIWHLCVYSKVDLVTLRKKSQVIIKDMAKVISDLFRALKRMKGNKTQQSLKNHFLVFKPNLFHLDFCFKRFVFFETTKPTKQRIAYKKEEELESTGSDQVLSLPPSLNSHCKYMVR